MNFRAVCDILPSETNLIWKEDETMTEGGLFIFLVILVLFVITVAVVTVVSAVTSAVAAIAQKDLEEDE